MGQSKNQGIGRTLLILTIILIVLAGIAALLLNNPSITGNAVKDKESGKGVKDKEKISSKKPSITGKVVEGKETIFSDNLNLQANESGTYEWQVKNPGIIKSLKASGSVTPNGTARVYIEHNGTRQLLFDSSKQLFDISISVLPEYKTISPGGEILVQIALFNVRGFGGGNVNVNYAIQDAKGNLIASEEESVFVETQAKFIRKLIIPGEIKPAVYYAFVKVSTNSTILGTGSDTFEVKSTSTAPPFDIKRYVAGFAAFAVLIALFAIGTQRYKTIRKKRQIAELEGKAHLEKTENLEKELKALEDAHVSKFISDESYAKEKARIEAELGKTRK